MRGTHKTVNRASGVVARAAKGDAKRRLLIERSEVAHALEASSLSRLGPSENSQDSDYASIEQMREVEYSQREMLSQRLHQLDQALERIGSGVYGLCAECGSRILDKRLANDPAVSLCLGCQAVSESVTRRTAR